MKLDQPLGDAAWGATVIRIALGYYLLCKGLEQLPLPPPEMKHFGPFKDVPPHFARLAGTLLPYFEVLAGALVLSGFWTILGAGLATIVTAFTLLTHGTFMGQLRNPTVDLVIFGAAIALFYLGGGFLSVDRFRSAKGGG